MNSTLDVRLAVNQECRIVVDVCRSRSASLWRIQEVATTFIRDTVS